MRADRARGAERWGIADRAAGGASDERVQIVGEHLRSGRTQIEEAAVRLEEAPAPRQASATRGSTLPNALRALGADPRVPVKVKIVD